MYGLLEEREVKMRHLPNYKIFKVDNKYEIWSAFGQFIMSCPDEIQAKNFLERMKQKEEVVFKAMREGKIR